MRPPLALAVLTVLVAVAPITSIVVPVAEPAAASTAGPTTVAADAEAPNATVTGIYRARAALWDDFDSATAVNRARERGASEPATPVVQGELLVVELDSRVLVDRLSNRSEPTKTARFFGLLNETNASLTIRQLNPTPERPAKAFALAPNATRVVAANATTYVIVDTATARLRWARGTDGTPSPDLYAGEEFGARFHVEPLDYDAFEDRPHARFVEARAVLDRATDSEPVRIAAANDTLVVRATTAPGTRVAVRLVADGTGSTLFERVVEVSPEGRSQITVPEGTVTSGTNATVSLRPRGYGVEPTRIAAQTVPTVARLGPVTVAEDAVRLRETNLVAGGFLVLSDESGTVVSVDRVRPSDRLSSLQFSEDADITAGTTLTIAAYRDTDGDGSYDATDEPYYVDGTPVRTTVTYGGTPTATATATPTVTGSPTPTATTTAPSPATPTATPGQPGLDALAVLTALAALLGLSARNGR